MLRITRDLRRETPSAAAQLVLRQPEKPETVLRPLFLFYVEKQKESYGGIFFA